MTFSILQYERINQKIMATPEESKVSSFLKQHLLQFSLH